MAQFIYVQQFFPQAVVTMENRQSAADFFDKIAVNGGRYVFFEKRSLQRPGKTAGGGGGKVLGGRAGGKPRPRGVMLF